MWKDIWLYKLVGRKKPQTDEQTDYIETNSVNQHSRKIKNRLNISNRIVKIIILITSKTCWGILGQCLSEGWRGERERCKRVQEASR